MARRGDQLTRAEHLAWSMANGEAPATWRKIEAARGGGASRTRRRRGLPIAIAATAIAVLGVLALELFTIRPGQPGAIFFPAHMSEAAAFAGIVAAGGLPVRPTRSVFGDALVWIAAPDDPAFFSNVLGNGAFVVINPFAFGGCMLVQP